MPFVLREDRWNREKKSRCQILTVCEDCEFEEEFEDTDLIKYPICEDLLCEEEEGKCKRQTCEVCDKEFCEDCMTKTKCELTTLCEHCNEDYDCVDCDICAGYY